MQSDADSIPWLKIVFVVVVLVVVMIIIVAIYRYQVNLQRTEPTLVSNPTASYSANDIKTANQTAALSTTGQEYTYNLWMYVDNWGKNYGKMKHVMTRATKSPFDSDPASAGAANPTIWLYPEENNLAVRVSTMKIAKDARKEYDQNVFPDYEYVRTRDQAQYTNVNPDFYYRTNRRNNPGKAFEFVNTTVACDVANIPLQRWVMVTVVLWNRTLDVYINGYLARSVVLPGAPLFDPADLSKIYIGGNNSNQTFGGYFSRMKYYNRAVTAEEVMGLYRDGPLPANYWWNALKYKIALTLDIDEDSNSSA